MIKEIVSGFAAVCLACALLCGCGTGTKTAADWDFPLSETNEELLENADEITTDERTEIYDHVSAEIKKVTESKEFSKADKDKRVLLLQPVIKELYDDGYISEYRYNLDGGEYSAMIRQSWGGNIYIEIEEHKH